MGAVHFSIDIRLIHELKRHLPLEVLIETGTFEGDTVAEVRSLFDVVHTVDLSETYYEQARLRFQEDAAVHVHLGRSPGFIAKLVPHLTDSSVLFWLDAHWCASEGTAGEASQCPLLEELSAIGHVNQQSVVLIDDARLFLCPPPSPHEITEWPAFEDVLGILRTLSSEHRFMVLNDVVMFFPQRLQQALEEFAHLSAIDWLSVMDKSRDYDRVLVEFENLAEDARKKDVEIAGLARVCSERLALIQSQSEEIEALRKLLKSTAYRLGFCIVNPLTAAKELTKRLAAAKPPRD